MGEAKRRGTFEQRKTQRLAKQYGLTNKELDEAYRMNRQYYRRFAKKSESSNILSTLMQMVNNHSY